MSPRNLLLAALLAGLPLSGCGGAPAPGEAPAPATQAPQDADEVAARGDAGDADAAEQVWLGVLPCADCDGIQTWLMLRQAGGERRYELQETYLGEDSTDNRFDQQGEWVEESAQINGEPAVVYRLDPAGPSRWFWRRPDGALEMLESRGQPAADGLAYRLQRL